MKPLTKKEIEDMEKKVNSIPREQQLSADELAAIEKAKEFKLENEVRYCILELGMSPEEALSEWDI